MRSPGSRSDAVAKFLHAGDPPLGVQPIHLPRETPPLLFVVVDTEEEFDWYAPFDRANTSVRAMGHIGRLQGVLSRYAIKPTYVVDFPIASQPEAYEPLKEIVDAGRARIGAHLHPWVNPPFVEEVTERNSFGCRLGEALETEKIRILQAEIANRFDLMPTVYKAGRYGFGPSTATALESLGFAVDLSVNPQMNYLPEGGQSFEAFDTTPFFFGRQGRLLEIPCSTDYTGFSGGYAPKLHRMISRETFRRLRFVGLMARLGAVNKVMLSPEGSTLAELKALTTSLFRRGVRTFSLTLHSPSVEPGCTPYVRTSSDLDEFIDRIAAYCDFFLGDLSGVASTPEEFRESLVSDSSHVIRDHMAHR
jgi:hypothetical protein